ncbi:MAG TPA: WXG100 family type VII secretion target, partial [Pseudonocardiaceae bacterium]|nr:WXG100 family type VII secretion target [Pseudonocardiaceae bacterium]
MSVSVLRGPDGGPPIGIKITPEDFHDVATRFVSASEELFQTQTGLLQQLGGLTGVAGVDTSAKQFDQSYQAAMQQWITGVYRAQNLLGDIANGIDWSARNHWMADASAVPGGGTPVPWQPVNPGLVLPSRVNAPSLVGNPQFDLPPWLSDHVPLPRLDALQELVTAFHGTRDAIENITSDLHNGLEFLFSNNSSPDLDALSEFWDKIGGASDSAILTALSRTCDDIASAI